MLKAVNPSALQDVKLTDFRTHNLVANQKFKKVPKDGAIVLFLDSAILQHIGQLTSEGFHQFSTKLVHAVYLISAGRYRQGLVQFQVTK